MLDLLQKFSISDIVIFCVMLLIALKESYEFIKWIKDRKKENYSEARGEEKKDEEIADKINTMLTDVENLTQSYQTLKDKIDLLINSDKDDIKSYITEKHHYYCYQLKWIDDFSMDCIEKRYSHYVEEKGNSFVEDLMRELRSLPHRPPTK